MEMAIEQYLITIRLKPDWEKPHFNLGRIYLRKGNIKEAIREFEKVLQINPQNYEVRRLLDEIKKNTPPFY
jgi:tetratricopeptide (TPR) repeat protein